jgi:hypothetical protein
MKVNWLLASKDKRHKEENNEFNFNFIGTITKYGLNLSSIENGH